MKLNILSVFIGLVSAIVVFVIAETLNNALNANLAHLEQDTEAMKLSFQNQAISVWLLVLSGWIIGSTLCGFLIRLISKSDNRTLAFVAGGILTLSAVANFLSLPHPTWFIVVGLICFIPSTLLGFSLYKKKSHE